MRIRTQLSALALERVVRACGRDIVIAGAFLIHERVSLDVDQERVRAENARHVDDTGRLPRTELARGAAESTSAGPSSADWFDRRRDA